MILAFLTYSVVTVKSYTQIIYKHMYIPQPTIFLHHVKSYTTDLLVDHEYDVKPVQRTTIIMCVRQMPRHGAST